MALNINGTTGISGVDGSNASPAIQGTDSNTGVSFGSDTVNINTGGATRATVDNSKLQTFGDAQFEGNDGTDNQLKWDKSDDSLYFRDGVKAQFGTGGDLKIYHDGGDSLIQDAGTGVLGILTNGFRVNNAANNESMIKADENGGIELYHDNSLKFQTKNDGVKISQEVVIGNATNAYPWTASGNVASGVLLNSLTSNVQFAISGNSNNTITCILNRTYSNGRILEFKYNGSVVGNIDTNGSSLPSDRDFKTNISDLNLGLSVVNKLKPSQFNYKIDDANTPVMYGLIAQDLEETLTSEGVTKNSTQLIQHHPTDDTESNYSVDYLKLLPILINSIKELSTEVVTLKTKVAALEAG